MIFVDEIKDFLVGLFSRFWFLISGNPHRRIQVLQLALLLAALPVAILLANERWHFWGKASFVTATVQGYVYDQSGHALSQVRVETIVDNHELWAKTNSNGFYKLALQTGNYAIKFSKSGYRTTTRVLAITSGQTLIQNWTLIHE